MSGRDRVRVFFSSLWTFQSPKQLRNLRYEASLCFANFADLQVSKWFVNLEGFTSTTGKSLEGGHGERAYIMVCDCLFLDQLICVCVCVCYYHFCRIEFVSECFQTIGSGLERSRERVHCPWSIWDLDAIAMWLAMKQKSCWCRHEDIFAMFTMHLWHKFDDMGWWTCFNININSMVMRITNIWSTNLEASLFTSQVDNLCLNIKMRFEAEAK